MCDHSPNREAAMVVVSDGVWCDPCLVPLVRALNEGGLSTAASRCGHGRRPATVILGDERVLILTAGLDEMNDLLDGWPDINAPLSSEATS